jgi:hypothetical protein
MMQAQKKSKQVSPPLSGIGANAAFSGNSLWLLGLGILVVAFVRVRLLSIPLERDEGEFAYMASLLLRGLPVYGEAYSLKLPGVPVVYSIFLWLFGSTTVAVHLGLLLVNVLTMVLFYSAFKKLFSESVAITSSLFYGFISLTPEMLGFAAHATHFVNLFIAAGFFISSSSIVAQFFLRRFLVGLSFGSAFVMKQQAVFLILFGIILVLLTEGQRRGWKKNLAGLSIFGAGVSLPYLVVIVFTLLNGTFAPFWFYTFQYGREYVGLVTWPMIPEIFMYSFSPMWKAFPLLWVFSAAGLVMVGYSGYSTAKKWIAVTFYFFSLLTIVPGFYFREHYFITWLPALAMMAAIGMEDSLKRIPRLKKDHRRLMVISSCFALATFIYAAARNPGYYFNDSPAEVCKTVYGTSPFSESVEIGRYLRANTKEGDRILVMGSEPQLPFYAGRLSATSYLYTYGLVEIQPYNRQMQQEYISQAEKAKPEFVLFINVANSWMIHPDAPRDIKKWGDQYMVNNYSPVGLVEVHHDRPADFFWNEEARLRKPQTVEFILILKKK